MPVSKWFRVATEGATTDGRSIGRSLIEQMAKNYDRSRYSARVWLEHFRGLLPDSPFKALGDVVGLKVEPVEDSKLGLFAQLDPTNELVAINRARQKLFSSIEIDPDFARSGQAYLVGMAVTDSPASLGTEVLKFCSDMGDANPMRGRKLKPDNLFTTSQEFVLELESDSPSETNLLDRVRHLLSGRQRQDNAVISAIETLAENIRVVTDRMTTFVTEADIQSINVQMINLDTEFKKLREQLSRQPATENHQIPPAAGSPSNDVFTRF